MNRRQMLQYLASITAGSSAFSVLNGCVHGGPPDGPDSSNGSDGTAGSTAGSAPKLAPRQVRAQHLYVAAEMAPGVDLAEFGFKRAVMLPAKSFADRNGMSSVPRMRTAIAQRVREVRDPEFRGPFVLDMEGMRYSRGLKSRDPQTYNDAARRMNSALADVQRVVPGALVSIYGSPFVWKQREDYAEALRAVQRLHGLTFLNPSLYDLGPRTDKVEQSEAEVRREYVSFACETAQRLGLKLVMPMLHFRYKGASDPDKAHSLQVIPQDEYVGTQVLAARDGGAHGLVIWHADLYRKRVADNPRIDVPADNRAVADRVYGDVSMAELAEVHRHMLKWTADAFLSDEPAPAASKPTPGATDSDS